MNGLLDNILNALPQTQCKLCGYDDCLAYATSVLEKNEDISKCQPGGEVTMKILSEVFSNNREKYPKKVIPKKEVINGIFIREFECIGCTRCAEVCPVEAILGGVKKVHFAALDICNGCNLCFAVCPVDCIDAIEHPNYKSPFEIAEQSISRYRDKIRKASLSKRSNI